jgi:hypothetical protein
VCFWWFIFRPSQTGQQRADAAADREGENKDRDTVVKKEFFILLIFLCPPWLCPAAERPVWVEASGVARPDECETVSEDAYVDIFSVAADGSVTLLLPNARMADNFVRANASAQFPPAGSRIALKAMFLPGCAGKTAEERIKIIVTKKREPLLSLGFQEGLFQVYDDRSTGMIGDLVRRLNAIDPADRAQAVAVYQLKK